MKIITIEEHYADNRIIESNAKYGYPSGMAELSRKVRAAYDGKMTKLPVFPHRE